jgi:proline racemase
VSVESTIGLPARLSAEDVGIAAAATGASARLAVITTEGQMLVAGTATSPKAVAGNFDDDPDLLCWVQ